MAADAAFDHAQWARLRRFLTRVATAAEPDQDAEFVRPDDADGEPTKADALTKACGTGGGAGRIHSWTASLTVADARDVMEHVHRAMVKLGYARPK